MTASGYFVVQGVSAVGGPSRTGEANASSVDWPSRREPATGRTGKVDATPILSRNPFDSVTGPLDEEAVVEPVVEEPKLDLSDPLNAPLCESIRVYSTIEADDPTWSSAVVQKKDQDASSLVKVGDTIGEKRVAYIGYNPMRASPAAWFVGTKSLCQSLVFSKRPRFKSALGDKQRERLQKKKRNAAKRRKARRLAARKARRKKRKRRPPPVPKAIASKLHRLSSDEFRIERDVMDTLLSSGPQLLKAAKIIPVQEDGKVAGMRLYNFGSQSLLGRLGFKNGDRIRKINGFDISSPEKALGAYARLRSASDITIQIERQGRPMTIDYRIR